MLIKRILIENFLPFRNITKVDFSENADRNITILLAENNVGKTSFLKAFTWCLYGIYKEDNNDVLNIESKTDLQKSSINAFKNVTVSLTLEHMDYEYQIIRTWKYYIESAGKIATDKSYFKIFKTDKNGNSTEVPSNERDSVINSILPVDLSEYFFYEEKKFMNLGATKNIKKSVEDFSGLTILNYAIKDVQGATKILFDKMKPLDNSKLAKVKLKVEKLNEDLALDRDVLARAEKESEYYKNRYNSKNEDLMAASQDDKIRTDWETNSKHLENLKKAKPELEAKVLKNFNRDYFSILSSHAIFRDALNVLDTADNGNPVDTVSGVDVSTIDQIISRGTCICGCKIIRGGEAYDNLQKLRQKVPPNNLSAIVREFRSAEEVRIDISKSLIDALKESYRSVSKNSGEIDALEDSVRELQEAVATTTDTRAIKADRDEAYEMWQTKEREIKNYESKITQGETEKAHLEDQIRILSRQDERNSFYQECYDYANRVKEKLQNTLQNKQADVLGKMNDYVGRYFKQLYHGNLSLYIDSDYSINTYNTYNDEKVSTKLSSGTNDIKNFAFVFGLERLARERLTLSEDPEDKTVVNGASEPYPLVLDGPFSHTDQGHIENLCKLIPSVSNQVIVAVSEKDWALSQKYLKDRVDRVYKMRTLTEVNTIIEESDFNKGDGNV